MWYGIVHNLIYKSQSDIFHLAKYKIFTLLNIFCNKWKVYYFYIFQIHLHIYLLDLHASKYIDGRHIQGKNNNPKSPMSYI